MPRIVFHHINKCAGTSLLKYFQNYFDSKSCIFVEECMPYQEYQQTTLDNNLLARSKFIHDPYGLYHWKDLLPNTLTMCFFRDPLQRIISNWWMICRWTDAEAESFPNGFFIRDLARNDPEKFFLKNTKEIFFLVWNNFCRHLSCSPKEILSALNNDELNSKEFKRFILNTAEKEILSLSFIGFQEDFNNSISAMQLWLSLPPEYPQPLNVHGNSLQKPSLNDSAIDAAKNLIELDVKLINIAKELYEKQNEMFKERYGSDFQLAAKNEYLRSISNSDKHWSIIDMSQPLNGTGWHCREINGTKYSRWIGPTPIATLDVPYKNRYEEDLFIRFRVTNIISLKQMNKLKVSINSYDLNLHNWHESKFVIIYDAIIPKDIVGNEVDLLNIKFDCVETIVLPNPDDGRKLGIEICEIEIGSAKNYILGKPGMPPDDLVKRGVSVSRND
jgi:hypothetical protein